jgi:nitrate/TMAO reductase-like tetraheme cytochrome c subunit
LKFLPKKKCIVTFSAGLLFAVFCYITICAAMEPFATSEYCGSNCHSMNQSYQTWELSAHGNNQHGIRVECIDCHLPPKEDFFHHVTAKAYAGAKDIYMDKFGPEYDREHQRRKVLNSISNDICMHCHNNLLGNGSNSSAFQVHKTILLEPEKPENRCVTCHENAGHEREVKIFMPH